MVRIKDWRSIVDYMSNNTDVTQDILLFKLFILNTHSYQLNLQNS